MAVGTGSKRVFTYTDDQANGWNVQLDESNAESAQLGFSDGVAGQNAKEVGSAFPFLMRNVLAQRVDADGAVVRRQFYVGSFAAFTAMTAAGTVEVSGLTYQITKVNGEERKLLAIADTGRLDGDSD